MPTSLSLVADIGGTNARFALADAAGNLQDILVLASKDYASLQAAIEAYLAQVQARVTQAAIAIANPITGDYVHMTNHHWGFSISQLREAMHWQELQVMNDFTAQALAVLALQDEEKKLIRAGVAHPAKPMAVIGPGTGLGVSGLLPNATREWLALAGEGGHVSLPVHTEKQWQIKQLAQQKYGEHVSAERILCGSGLAFLDAACAQLAGKHRVRSAPEVTEAALAGEAQAREVVALFMTWLADVAANVTLTIGATGGVYLCGGILPKLAEAIDWQGFNEAFTAKGRMSAYLQDVPVFLVLAEQIGLRGAAIYARQHHEHAA